MKKATLRLGFLLLPLALVACQSNEDSHPADRKVVCLDGRFYDSRFASGIIGGETANENSWFSRKTVFVYQMNSGSMCTGSLITSDVILTAAHCVEGGASETKIIFSAQPECDSESSTLSAKAWDVKRIVVHPQYSKNSTSDLALIQMKGPAPAGFSPVKLAEAPFHWQELQSVLAVGYGQTVGGPAGKDPAAVALRAVVLSPLKGAAMTQARARLAKLVEKERFSSQAVESALDEKFSTKSDAEYIWVDQMGGKGVCSGDSGGPAFASIEGQIYQVGVASFVAQDSKDQRCKMLGAYTNVQVFMPWLKSTVRNLYSREAYSPPQSKPGKNRSSNASNRY